MQTGYLNPIDSAILNQFKFDVSQYNKIDEIPYDFKRRLLTIILKKDNERFAVTKGSV